MLYVKSIKVLNDNPNFIFLDKEDLYKSYYICEIDVYDTDKDSIYSLDYTNLDESLKIFGLIIKCTYMMAFTVREDLWKLLDYVDEPKLVFKEGYFSSKDDSFLKYLSTKSNNIVGKRVNHFIHEYNDYDNGYNIIVIFIEDYKPMDSNNVFWLNSHCKKINPTNSFNIFCVNDSDILDLLKIYYDILNNNLEFNENTKIYVFKTSYGSCGYELSLNKDAVRFLTKLKCIKNKFKG